LDRYYQGKLKKCENKIGVFHFKTVIILQIILNQKSVNEKPYLFRQRNRFKKYDNYFFCNAFEHYYFFNGELLIVNNQLPMMVIQIV
jgi:hypothetical protein